MNRTLSQYFDQMAKIIRLILEKNQYTDKEFNSVYCDRNSQETVVLRNEFSMLVGERHGEFKDVSIRMLNSSFFEKIQQVIDMQNPYLLMLLLYYMDKAVIECYQHLVGFEDEIETMESLNMNLKTTDIAVLRRMKCKWEHKSLGAGLNGILSNFYFIDYRELNGISVENHIIDSRLFFKERKDSLKFALSPVTKEKVVCFSNPYRGRNAKTGASQMYFRVEGLENKWGITKQILENIYEAGKNHASVLVFPEMLGNREMLSYILEELKGKREIPEIIVFPSIWEKTEDDEQNTNKSCLILNGEEILFEQCKHCNYSYPMNNEPVYEDINRKNDKNNVVHLLHLEGVGRICIIICYDYLDSEYRNMLMRNLRPTLVCSPSFSTGSFNFRVLEECYLEQGCNWIWCNTCSASNETKKKNNFETIGVITTLDKQRDMRNGDTFKKICEGKSVCESENCDKCIYYADISLLA